MRSGGARRDHRRADAAGPDSHPAQRAPADRANRVFAGHSRQSDDAMVRPGQADADLRTASDYSLQRPARRGVVGDRGPGTLSHEGIKLRQNSSWQLMEKTERT